MQRGELRIQLIEIAAIDHHIVSDRQSFGARRLSRHDRPNLGGGQATARDDSRNLRRLVAIDDQDPVDALAIRRRSSRFDEQRNNQQDVRGGGRRPAARLAFAADQRVKNGLDSFFCRWIGKNQAAHCRPIESAIIAHDGRAKGGGNLPHGGALYTGQLMRNDVGIDQRGAETGQPVGNRALAAADAAGQANDQAHGVDDFLQIAKRPSGSSSAIALRNVST